MGGPTRDPLERPPGPRRLRGDRGGAAGLPRGSRVAGAPSRLRRALGIATCLAGIAGGALFSAPAATGQLEGKPPRIGSAEAEARILEFKKFYRREKNPEALREAVMTLRGIDSVDAARTLGTVLTNRNVPVRDLAVEILGEFRSPEVQAWIRDALLASEEVVFQAPALRILALQGDRSVAPRARELLADPEADLAVRMAAAWALGRLKDPEAVPPLVETAREGDLALRSVSLDALGEIGAKEGLPAVHEALRDESWTVRAAACAAAGKIRDRSSIDLLIAMLGREKGRLREDAREALIELTGYFFPPDPEHWTGWWERNREKFRVPSAAQVRKQKAIKAKQLEKYGDLDYHGISSTSRNIVFVIDISASMSEQVQHPENFGRKKGVKLARIDVVKEELARTVERLPEDVNFNILVFASKVDRWKRDLIPANAMNRRKAVRYVKKLKPKGGLTMQRTRTGGLSMKLSDPEGARTNTYAALAEAIGGRAGEGISYRFVPSKADTVFFLSDGEPTVGEIIDEPAILKAIRAQNVVRKVTLHTIGIGEFQKGFLKQLAGENGGQFVDLGS